MRGMCTIAIAALLSCCAPHSSGPAAPVGAEDTSRASVFGGEERPDVHREGATLELVESHRRPADGLQTAARDHGAGGDDSTGHDHGAGHDHELVAVEASAAPVDPQIALLGWSDDRLGTLIDEDPARLGSVSAGKPNGGALLNGVRLEEDPRWEIVDPRRSFATAETLEYLRRAVGAVHEQFPEGTHPMFVGHLSRESGGRLWPHRSHQSGRDVDLGYYYQAKYAEWYRPATPHTLDRPRTWAFVKALLTRTDVEYIFISTRVQMLLKEYALEIGEDPDWLNSVFEFRSRNPEPIIRHTYGHRTHMHVRFFNPKAQGVGIRAYDLLAKRRLISPRVRLQPYLARPGDSYAKLAKLAGHSARVLERTNRDEELEPGQLIAVPIRGTVQRVESLEVPPRRRPPGQATTVSAVAGPADG